MSATAVGVRSSSARDAMVEIRARPIGNGASGGIGKNRVGEVEFTTIVTFGPDNDRGSHALVERPFDFGGLSRAGRDQQIRVECSPEDRRVREDGGRSRG